METKICSKCKQTKSINEFYARPDIKGKGYESHCIECCKNKKKKWYERRKFDHDVRFKNLKSAAKQRNLEFTLTVETYSNIVSKPCHYCNESLEKHAGSGIDRINNHKGYTLENSVSCCSDCNLGKGEAYTYEEWKIMIEALLEFRKKNGRGQRTRTAGPIKARSV